MRFLKTKRHLTSHVMICLGFVVFCSFLWSPRINSGLPYLYHEDEAHHHNRIVEMVKEGRFNPQYFLKPSLHFYVRMPLISFAFLKEVGKGRARALSDIKTRDLFGLAGYSFTTSHPGLVKYNRLLSAVIAVIIVFLTYGICVQARLGFPSALFGTLVVAVSPLYFEYGTLVGVDVVMTVCVLLSVCLAVRYLDTSNVVDLIASSLFAGLAISSKYNAAPALIIPLIAGLSVRTTGLYMIAGVPFIVALAFIAGTPFLLVEYKLFLNHLAYEVWHYGVAGHEGHSGTPGISQALFYLQWLGQKGVGWSALLSSVLGPILFCRGRYRLIGNIFLFPVLFFCLMSTQKVHFTRNLFVVIPFIGIGVAMFLEVLKIQLKSSFHLCLYVLGIIILAQPVYLSIGMRRFEIERPESRKAVEQTVRDLIKENPNTSIAISGEIQLPSSVYQLPGIYRYNSKHESMLDLALKGYSTVFSLPWEHTVASKQIVKTFEGEKEEQRIVENPEVLLFKNQLNSSSPEIRSHVKAHFSLPVLSAEPYECETLEEGHCWVSSKIAFLPVNVDDSASLKAITCKVMSPWADLKASVLGEEEQQIGEPGKWNEVTFGLDPITISREKGFFLSLSKVQSPLVVDGVGDSRHLGLAIQSCSTIMSEK